MKMLRLAAVLWTAGCVYACSSQPTASNGGVSVPVPIAAPATMGALAAPRDPTRGVTIDERWRVFGDAWARIASAKTPQEYEDAINAHPLAGKIHHNVAGAFHRYESGGFPDCHVGQSIANNTSTVAVYVDGSVEANDTIYAYIQDTGSDYFMAFDDTCQQRWNVPISAPVEGAINGSSDGLWFAFMTNDGAMNLFYQDGTPINTVSGTGALNHTTPWLNSNESPLGIYYFDSSGALSKQVLSGPDPITGLFTTTSAWSHTVGSGAESHSLPVEVNGFVYVANDDGQMFVYNDAGTLKAGPTSMCSGASCQPTDAVWSYPVILGGGNFYYAVSNKVHEYTTDATNGCVKTGSACTATNTSAALTATATIQGSPLSVDFFQSGFPAFFYVGYRGRFYRMSANLATVTSATINCKTFPTTTVSRFGKTLSAPLSQGVTVGTDASGNYIALIGDDDGYMDRFDVTSGHTLSRLASRAGWTDDGGTVTCAKVDSVPLGGSTGATQWIYINCGLSTGTSSALIQVDPAFTNSCP